MDISLLQSPEIGELIKAWSEAKKEYKPFMGEEKGNYGKYASSDDIKEATFEALHKHGLVFIQSRFLLDNGLSTLRSMITHTSGQWMASYVQLILDETENTKKKDINQRIGSSLTYQRRYEAYGFLGLGKGDGTEDPDYKPTTYNPKPPQPQGANAPKSGCISEAQLYKLNKALDGDKEYEKELCKHFKINDLSELPWKYMDAALKAIEGE